MNERWVNCSEHVLCARLRGGALDIEVFLPSGISVGEMEASYERSRKGKRDDCRDLAPVSVCVCGRVGITPLGLVFPLQRKLTSARTASIGV